MNIVFASTKELERIVTNILLEILTSYWPFRGFNIGSVYLSVRLKRRLHLGLYDQVEISYEDILLNFIFNRTPVFRNFIVEIVSFLRILFRSFSQVSVLTLFRE